MKQTRNIYLDILRALSALAVIVFHYTTRYEELFGHIGNYPLRFSDGGKAVAFFFMLSGYFASHHLQSKSVKEYACKRFFRLFPVYWVSLLIIFPMTRYFLPSRAVSWKDFLLSFTMLQGGIGTANVDGAHWTLYHELIFYILLGIILALHLSKHLEKICLLWLAVRVTLLLLPSVKVVGYASFVFSKCCLGNAYGHMFMVGILYWCIERHIVEKAFRSWDGVWFTLCVVGVGVCVWLQYVSFDMRYTVYFIVFIALFAIALLCGHILPKPSETVEKILRPILFFASISYSVYLLHQNLGYIIIQKTEQCGLVSEWWILVPIAVMIFLGYLFTRFIEQPCGKLCKTLLQGKKRV